MLSFLSLSQRLHIWLTHFLSLVVCQAVDSKFSANQIRHIKSIPWHCSVFFPNFFPSCFVFPVVSGLVQSQLLLNSFLKLVFKWVSLALQAFLNNSFAFRFLWKYLSHEWKLRFSTFTRLKCLSLSQMWLFIILPLSFLLRVSKSFMSWNYYSDVSSWVV